jgi:hypothetical protein
VPPDSVDVFFTPLFRGSLDLNLIPAHVACSGPDCALSNEVFPLARAEAQVFAYRANAPRVTVFNESATLTKGGLPATSGWSGAWQFPVPPFSAFFPLSSKAQIDHMPTVSGVLIAKVGDLIATEIDGGKGERVSIELTRNPAGTSSGDRVTLQLIDAIRGVTLIRADRSGLPNTISTKLPGTGRYFVAVTEQSRLASGSPFRGAYCLSVTSSAGAQETLAPHAWIE